MLLDKLKELRECLVGMMDAFPNPAIAVVTAKEEKKPKSKKAEVDSNAQKEELR